MTSFSTFSSLEVTAVIVRVALGTVLLLAGGLKLRQHSDSESLIQALGLRPARAWLRGLSILPFLELTLGAWLLLGRGFMTALMLTLLLLSAFTLALFVLRRRDYYGSCACFGTLDRHPIGSVQIVRNGVLVAAAAFALVQGFSSSGLDLAIWELPVIVTLSMLVLLLIAFVLYVLALEIEAFVARAANGKGLDWHR